MSTAPDKSFVEFTKAEIQQSIPDKFEQIVFRYPDNVAVSTSTRSLSYDELNVAANCVARSIISLVGERCEPIALLMDHDAVAIIGILGVLKADKFYVPLDPRHPHTRNSYILRETRTRLVLTNTVNYSRAQKLCGNAVELLNIDTIESGMSAKETRLHGSPDRLAYVIYTSGSTGTPKGVMQNHRNVLHRVMTYTNSVRICATDRVALLYSYSSSGSVRDIFGALLNGAALLPFSLREEGWTALTKWLMQEEITVYNSAATVFRRFGENLSKEDRFPKLRSIHVGSETIYKRDAELYKEHFSDECVFVARLGSTEISPICEYAVHKRTEIIGNTVPAGYVVGAADAEVLLLAENGRAVGLNEVGEIAVRSPYLFSGYWERPDLTQAAIVPDPTGGDTSVFRTGDLGRMRFDGCVEHLGRKDYQVKINGHRVETGEIEAALCEHPRVREAVALAEETSENKRLVAYLVLCESESATAGDLRDFLKTKLPDYMIPAAFLIVDKLPRTANGKLDRSRLTFRVNEAQPLNGNIVDAHDAVERALITIWEAILGVWPITVQSNFFDLGGDSLAALQMIASVEKAFGIDIPATKLLQSPSVQQLAAIIREEKGTDYWSSLVPVQPAGSRPPFFWVQGDFSSVYLSRQLGRTQPLYLLNHQSEDGMRAQYTEVETIANYYLREIFSVQKTGPFFLGGYSFGGIVALEIAQELNRQKQEVGLLALLDPPPFSGTSSPSNHTASFHDSICRHVRALAALTTKKQTEYILHRLNGTFNSWMFPVRKVFKRMVCRVCVTFGRRIPLALRTSYILDVYRHARTGYVPRPYSGRVILFKGENRSYDSKTDWDGLLKGELEIHKVSSDHTRLKEQPDVQIWAEKLKSALFKAQSNQSTPPDKTNLSGQPG